MYALLCSRLGDTFLYKGIAAHEKEIQFSGKMLTKDTVNRVFHAVTHDNPYFYYFNQTHLDYAYSPFGSVFLPRYFCSEEQVADYNNRIQECVNQLILNTVNGGCIVVSGKASLYRQGEHAWNIVKEGKWKHGYHGKDFDKL